MTDLFGQVIEISLSMSVLIVILFVFSKTMHQRYRASVVVLAWLAIALRLILPWNITLPSAAVTIPVPQRMVQPLPVGSSFTEIPQPETEPQLPSPSFSEHYEKAEENPTPATGFSISILQILTVIWIIGMGLSVLRLTLDYYRVKKLLMARGQRVSRQSPQGRLLRQLGRKIKMKKIPPLIASRSAPTPMAIGFLNPAIVLAPELLEHENLDLILKHELIHLKQKDLWKKVLLSAAQTIHWFNPFVWLMNNQAENDIEMACDQRLLKGQSKEVRAVYGRMIVDVIRQTRLPMTAFSTRFSSGKPLKKRIQALFDSSRKKKGTLILTVILLSAGVGSMLVACSVQAQPQESEERLLQISRNDENVELMLQSEDPEVLETMQKVLDRQREPISDPYYYDLKIHYNGQDYLAWTNPRWLYLNDQQGNISCTDDPYALYDFYALIGYEQPEIKTGEFTMNPIEGRIDKISVPDIREDIQPEKEVNWAWIQPNQYPYFDVFSNLHGEYVEIGKNTWIHQNQSLAENPLFTFIVNPGEELINDSYFFYEPVTICFIKGNLAIINDWLVQLDRDYLNTIQNLLTNLSDTGSHFESLEEEAQLKKQYYKESSIYSHIIDPVSENGKTVYEISGMNLRILVDQEVPSDVFMIYDSLSKSASFEFIEWPIDRLHNYYDGGCYSDGFYKFSILTQEDLNYKGPESILAEEVYRFNDHEIICITSDLDMMLPEKSINYMKSVGYYPKADGKLELLDHLTFEKIR